MNKKDFILNQLLCLDKISKSKLKEYVDFCFKNNLHAKHNNTELHHILPKAPSLWPEFKNLNVFEWNGVHLKFEDHYKAHSILADACSQDAIIYAWWNMNSQNFKQMNIPKLIGQNKYDELKIKHKKCVSAAQTVRNRSEHCIQKRHKTMSKIGEDGLSTYQRQGRKISETLKKNESCKGNKNSMYNKIILKERLNPEKRKSATKEMLYDTNKYVYFQTKYLKLYDNTGELYFSGWRDEANIFCDNLGLDSKKLISHNGTIFNYKGSQNAYLIKVMKIAGLGKYLNSTVEIIKDKNVKF